MQRKRITIGLSMIGLLALAACGDKEPALMNIRTDTPDEFSILPTKNLEAPEDYEALPEPTPGGTNRADINPFSDAAVALGGSDDAVVNGQSTASEGTLLAYAGRYGATESIRGVLAEEDEEFRRENNGRLLERLFNVPVYYDAYESQELDQHLELLRLREAGVLTPSAPPDPEAY